MIKPQTTSNTKHSSRIVFWWPVPDPYMIDRFNALADLGEIDFECWYSAPLESGRSWKLELDRVRFPYRFVPTLGIGKHRTSLPILHWLKTRPELLISLNGIPLVAGAVIQHLNPKGKLIYYIEKTFDTWIARSPLKELLKRVLYRVADGILSPGSDADEYARKYTSVTPIHRLNHVIQVDRFAEAIVLRETPILRKRREDLRLTGFVYVNVGRMWKGKGIETLLDAFALLQEEGIDVSLLLVGDGVDKTKLKAHARRLGLKHVTFLDFVQQPDLHFIYALADAFVFPTLGDPYGLVVDEALASGIPVISSTSAGEIESRISPGQTGLLVPPLDSKALGCAMRELALNPSRSRRMGEMAGSSMQGRTPSSWAIQMTSIIRTVLADE